MTNGQERDLRDAFEDALRELWRAEPFSRIKNSYEDSTMDSAVVLVIGEAAEEAICTTDELIEKWDTKAAGQ